jgi:hypothetical protein
MSSNLNFQINYGNIGVTSPAAAPAMVRADPKAPLFASEDGMVASLSNNECIFQVRSTGETHVMTYQVLQALDQCREFRSLDEHVNRILSTVSGLNVPREGVSQVLQSLVGRGLVVEDRAFLARLAETPAVEQAPLRAVFIRACDRPLQLERLLASLTDYERRFRAGHRYVVIDDSVQPESIDRHRDLLREFARSTGAKLTYLGVAEQARLVERLIKAVPAARAAAPQLLLRDPAQPRFGGGRGWNLALLLSAGARLAMFDDDQRLPLRRSDDAREGLDPNPTTPAHVRFFRNIEESLGAGEEVADDPFELHLEASGQALGALSRGARYAIDRTALRGLSLGRLEHLRGGARVLATMHGTTGSSRTESGTWLYQIAADGREDFARDRDSYLRNIEAGSLWYGFQQARVATIGYFTPFTLDNSVLLPCTNPVGRGEDALFSTVTRLIHPQALVMELPVVIGHVQEAARKRSARTQSAHTPRFNHFVSDYVQRQLPDFLAADPAQRLSLLACHLRDIAGAGESARVRHLQEYLSFARADLIERLQQQFESASDAPVHWQADVRTIIEANGRALLAGAAPRLGDWPDTATDADVSAALRSELGQLAAGYEAWPALWSHARDEGERLLSGL